MRRGEIWTAAGGKEYAGKPRPVVIVQDDRFDMTPSIAVCAFTTDPTDAPLIRLPVAPSKGQRAARAVSPHGGQTHDGSQDEAGVACEETR